MSCGLKSGYDKLKCSGTIQSGYYTAPPKRQLLIEKFGDYGRTLNENAYWVLKYNNALTLDSIYIMSINTIKIDEKRYVAHYWPEDNGKWDIMLQEMYEGCKIII
jgi:hypothetical protein